MRLVYRIVSDLFLLISPIIIFYRILKGKEDVKRFCERYAINTKKRSHKNIIWFHCSSVGELMSIVPILEKFEIKKNVHQILVTTTTLSSSKIFSKLNLKKTTHQFFPIDNNFVLDKFLNYWSPSILFLCESEIWPNLIYKINKKKIKLILLNGRMTSKTFSRWKALSNFSLQIFKKFDKCFAQNSETKNKLSALGANKIYNLGNLKFSTSKKIKGDFLERKILNYFKSKKILITAASTHHNEENFIIQNHLYFKNKKKINNLVSIIVPRHVERVDQIRRDIENSSLKVHLHSSKKRIKSDTEVYIVDTYGELNKFYKISNIVFLGGSLINHGGQNPLEPAKLGCKIIHGPNVANFSEIYKKLNKMGITKTFNNYNKGTQIIKKFITKKKFLNENKKLINYGEKILNLTFSEIEKII